MHYDADDDMTTDSCPFIPSTMQDRSHWVTTRDMAKKLGISYRTIHKYKSLGGIWEKGHHYAPQTPLAKSKLMWDPEPTIAAWNA